MTDKQIIIDGCDVSGCKHYKNRTCIADYCLTDMPFGEAKCELNPNCHYKQLKAKEQECEELKKQLIKCDDNIIVDCEYSKKDLCSFIHRKKEVINGLQQQLDQLKAENKELKRQRQANKGLITLTGKMNYQLLQEYDKLKSALTEIKEIAEKQCICGVDCIDMKQILQKISEVENEN